MYENFFGLQEQPFSLTPNTQFFCELPRYQEALNVLLFSLEQGEGFLKITGEVGLGKTLLCRELLNRLPNQFKTAYIPNPMMTPAEFNLALARELGVTIDHSLDQHTLQQKIQDQLINLRNQGLHSVLIVDESQCMSDEMLEALRLITNLETESTKLLQVVLFGQPELDARLSKTKFRQLQQRITFSYTLTPLTREETDAYISHRLMAAGYKQGALFTKKAKKKLYTSSQGVPRIINIIANKAILAAYGSGAKQIDSREINHAISDSKDLVLTTQYYSQQSGRQRTIVFSVCFLIIGALALHIFAKKFGL